MWFSLRVDNRFPAAVYWGQMILKTGGYDHGF